MRTEWIEKWTVRGYWMVVLLYVTMIGYAVANRLPCDTDETAILNPAVLISQGEPMAVPIAGPGAGHDSGFWYQLPLHPYLLGLWMRVFGTSLFAATAFSWLHGLIALLLIYLFRKHFGVAFIAAAACFLFTDTNFTPRMSMVRYDGLSVIFSFFAMWLLIGREGFRLCYERWFLAGLCLGLSSMNNFLFVLYIPALCGAATILDVWKRPLPLLNCGLLMGVGVLVGFFPAVVYAFRAWDAFEGQFLYHIFELSDKGESFIAAELGKYWNYYGRRPLTLLFSLFALAYLGMQSLCLKRKDLAALGLCALLTWVLVSLASGGKPWHHFVVMPALALAVGAAVRCALSEGFTSRSGSFCRRSLPHLFLLGGFAASLANGFALGPLRITLEAYLEENTRHYNKIGAAVEKIIPDGASVFGTRRIFLTAHANDWDFVADYYTLLHTAENLGAANEFEWLVLERGKEERIQADIAKAYNLVDSYTQERAAIDDWVERFPLLHNYFVYRGPRTFDIYEQKIEYGSN